MEASSGSAIEAATLARSTDEELLIAAEVVHDLRAFSAEWELELRA